MGDGKTLMEVFKDEEEAQLKRDHFEWVERVKALVRAAKELVPFLVIHHMGECNLLKELKRWEGVK